MTNAGHLEVDGDHHCEEAEKSSLEAKFCRQEFAIMSWTVPKENREAVNFFGCWDYSTYHL